MRGMSAYFYHCQEHGLTGVTQNWIHGNEIYYSGFDQQGNSVTFKYDVPQDKITFHKVFT